MLYQRRWMYYFAIGLLVKESIKLIDTKTASIRAIIAITEKS